jgi:cytochrome c-type biogenesis protein CcmE
LFDTIFIIRVDFNRGLLQQRAMRKRYFVGGGILLVAVIYLLYLSFGDSVSYYVTVSEFYDRETELQDVSIRVAGEIVEGSVSWDAESLELRFTINEGGKDMPVTYHGTRPSGFSPGSNILVEGRYTLDGIFMADKLILKCPSKYESLE